MASDRAALHQIVVRRGLVQRQPPGLRPTVEMLLEPHERLVSLALIEHPHYPSRKTVDWTWEAVVDVDLAGVSHGE